MHSHLIVAIVVLQSSRLRRLLLVVEVRARSLMVVELLLEDVVEHATHLSAAAVVHHRAQVHHSLRHWQVEVVADRLAAGRDSIYTGRHVVAASRDRILARRQPLLHRHRVLPRKLRQLIAKYVRTSNSSDRVLLLRGHHLVLVHVHRH